MTRNTPPEDELKLLAEIALLRAHGKPWEEVAGEVDAKRPRLRELTRKYGAVYRRILEREQHTAAMEAASRARGCLERLLESENERVALRAAQALLADQRGRERNAVLSERNAVIAGMKVSAEGDADSRRRLVWAEKTLAAYRRGVKERVARGQSTIDEELSDWEAAYEAQYGGDGDDEENLEELVERARAAARQMREHMQASIEARRNSRGEKRESQSQSPGAQ